MICFVCLKKKNNKMLHIIYININYIFTVLINLCANASIPMNERGKLKQLTDDINEVVALGRDEGSPQLVENIFSNIG